MRSETSYISSLFERETSRPHCIRSLIRLTNCHHVYTSLHPQIPLKGYYRLSWTSLPREFIHHRRSITDSLCIQQWNKRPTTSHDRWTSATSLTFILSSRPNPHTTLASHVRQPSPRTWRPRIPLTNRWNCDEKSASLYIQLCKFHGKCTRTRRSVVHGTPNSARRTQCECYGFAKHKHTQGPFYFTVYHISTRNVHTTTRDYISPPPPPHTQRLNSTCSFYFTCKPIRVSGPYHETVQLILLSTPGWRILMTTSETSHNLHAVHSQSESQFNFSTEKMSFFSFKSRPKKSKTSPGHGGEDPEVLEPLQYHQPIYQNTPLLRNNNIDNRNFVDSNSSSAASSRSNTAAILPPGVSLVNPSLQPDKARTFAGIRLPQTFQVRFLGVLPASGIWGIKHTRTVVDGLVEAAKALDSDDLTLLDLEVAEQGIHLRQISPTRPGDTSREIDLGEKPIERISWVFLA